MDLKGTQLKQTFGNLVTIGTSAGTPTTGTLQNGDGSNITSLDISAATNKNLNIKALPAFDNFSNQGVGIALSRTSSDADLMALGVVDTDKLGLFSRSGIILATGGSNAFQHTSEVIRIDGSGNLGLGISSPDYKAHIFDDTITSSTKTLLQFDSNSIADGGGYNIDFRTSSNDTANRFVARIQGAREGSGATSQLSFFTDDGSTLNKRMLINASGNVAIGANAPIEVSSTANWLTLDSDSGSSVSGGIVFAIDGTSKAVQYIFGSNVLYDAKSGIGHQFTVNNGTEVMRMDTSANLLVGKTSSGIATEGVEFNTASHFTNFTRNRDSVGGTIMQVNRTGAEADGSLMSFMREGSEKGSITVTGSATAYNTSSDYRLKENITSLSSALETISKIKPSTFNFIDTPNETVDGFIAHELAEVVSYAVSGEKDGIDEDGNPIYQGVDHSKLVPLLVGAIQELKSEIEQLKNK